MKFLLLLITLSLVYGGEGNVEIASMEADIAKYQTDLDKAQTKFEVLVQERKLLAVKRLKDKLANAKGDDALAISEVLKGIDAQEVKPEAKTEKWVSEKEFDAVRKEEALKIRVTYDKVTTRIRLQLLKSVDAIGPASYIQASADLSQAGGSFSVPTGNGRYYSHGTMVGITLGVWCSDDPARRFALCKKAGIDEGMSVQDFVEHCFSKYRGNAPATAKAVRMFAQSVKDERFDEFLKP